MGDASGRVVAEALAPDAWTEFGWIPVEDTDPADGRERLTFSWGDPHLNVIMHGPEEIEHRPDGLHCDAMYRHDSHTQALLVLNVDAVVAVAPPGTEFREPADAQRIRAFVLRPGQSFVLHAGTWHWGPFPLGEEPVRLYNLQGLGYRDDNARVDLEAAGAAVDVVVTPG
ncbi:MAG TPA: ureidoglycolate lyase [Acidimicrobiales bacterium]|nr:ureidoglycolate lyase [Acidimicrobiales bacterium]